MRLPPSVRRPVPPLEFGETTPGMGDPTSVPEDPNIGYRSPPPQPVRPIQQAQQPDYGPPLLVHLPAHLACYFQVGFAHSDEICPLIVFRVMDEETGRWTEITGPAEDFMSVARTLAGISSHVPCINPMHNAEVQPDASRRAG
jgi:hypothetical protein